MEEGKRLRNEVGRSLRDLRADYLKQQQEAHKADPKKFWKSVSSIIPDKKTRSAETKRLGYRLMIGEWLKLYGQVGLLRGENG